VVVELDPVIAGLRDVREKRAAPAAGSDGLRSVDPERVKELLSKLETLLADSDAQAADVVDDLCEAVAGGPLADAARRITSAIGAFDFDAALDALHELRDGLLVT
jgi:hypothetical protein